MPKYTVLLLGCGAVGSATARLLIEDGRFQRIVVADRHSNRAAHLAETLDGRVTAVQMACYRDDQLTAALTGVSVAALTLYDMCKSADRGMTIENIVLLRKSGGRSGDFCRA